MSAEEESKKEEAKPDEGGDDGTHEVEENTAHFEPVVSHGTFSTSDRLQIVLR